MNPGPRRLGPATVRIERRGGRLWIEALFVPRESRGFGHGGRLLDAVCAEADAAEVRLHVHAIAHDILPEGLSEAEVDDLMDAGHVGLTGEDLEEFYARRGFVGSRREPRQLRGGDA